MPVKFDDIPKVSADVLNDDFQTSGYMLKAKQKTNYGGTVLTTQVDLFGKDAVATPAKITWKWPTPLGFGSFNIDKLEMDKGGKYKLEASSDKAYPGLKLECKSDLVDTKKIMAGCTYTGLKDTQIKFECKAVQPQDFSGEATFTKGPATYGLKYDKGTPALGVRYASGALFCSLLAKDSFSTFNAHVFYKANADFKCAGTYQHGGKGNGNFTIGVAYKGIGKVKFTQDHTLSCSAKHNLAKGFSVLPGFSFNRCTGKVTYGLQLSIE